MLLDYICLTYYIENGLEDLVYSDTTYLSLGYDDEAVEIMNMIVQHFGGWIDENDCDDNLYTYVGKNKESETPVIHVTMEEIYEKFGGIVIIDK